MDNSEQHAIELGMESVWTSCDQAQCVGWKSNEDIQFLWLITNFSICSNLGYFKANHCRVIIQWPNNTVVQRKARKVNIWFDCIYSFSIVFTRFNIISHIKFLPFSVGLCFNEQAHCNKPFSQWQHSFQLKAVLLLDKMLSICSAIG